MSWRNTVYIPLPSGEWVPAFVAGTMVATTTVVASVAGYLATTRDEFQTGPTGPRALPPTPAPTGPTGATGTSFFSVTGFASETTGPDGPRGPPAFYTGPTGPTGPEEESTTLTGPVGIVIGPDPNLGTTGVTLYFSDGADYNESFPAEMLNYGMMSLISYTSISSTSLTRPSITGPNPIFMSFSSNVNTTYKGAMATFADIVGVRYNPWEVLSLASDDNGRFFYFVFNNLIDGDERFLTWDDADTSIHVRFSLIIGNNT